MGGTTHPKICEDIRAALGSLGSNRDTMLSEEQEDNHMENVVFLTGILNIL